VSEVVAADELAERAAEVAQLFAAMPTRAVWETKRLLDEAETASLERQLEHEALTQAKLVGTPDFEEGVAAFLEKREAHFTGSSGEPFHPIELTNADDRRRWRLTVAIRVLLAIPHLYLFYYWTLVAVLVSLVNWPITLVRGRSPRGVHLWLSRYLRHATHAFAYVFLMADEFPRFRGWEGTYAVDLAIAETPLSQPRWKTLFRIVLAIPPVVLASLLFLSVLPVVALLAWFFALATARMPKGFQSLGAYCLRYTAQTAAYVLLLTDRYPSLATRDVTLDAPPRS
jgi:hypothetical protein